MATGATDFSEYADDASLTDEDWTQLQSTQYSHIVFPGGPIGKFVRATRSGSGTTGMQSILRWDKTPSSAAWEALVLTRVEDVDQQNNGAAVQLVGTEGYVGGTRNGGVDERLYRISGNDFAEDIGTAPHGVDTTDWHWSLVRREGNSLKLKTWQFGGSPPENWGIEATNTVISDPGHAGLSARLSEGISFIDYGYFAYDSEGGSVPIPGEAEDQPVTLTGQTRSLALSAPPGDAKAGAALEGSAAQLFVSALTGTAKAGTRFAGEVVALSLAPANGDTQAGYNADGQTSALSMDAHDGGAQAGQSLEGQTRPLSATANTGDTKAGADIDAQPVMLSLTANAGTLIIDDSVPVVLLGQTAGLSLATQTGQAIYGVRIEGDTASLVLQSNAGQLIVGDSIPLVLEGKSALLSASAETGFVSAGALLEGAVVALAADANSGETVVGQVLDGDVALLSLIAQQGQLFTGLVLATPIRRTRAVDVSTSYRARDIGPHYAVSDRTTTHTVKVL